MATRRNAVLVVGILAASFAGGAVSHWLLSASSAVAQVGGQVQGPQTVTAERFELVDADGNLRGLLQVDENGSGLVLHDADGHARTAIGVPATGTPGVFIFDAAGQVRAALGESSGVIGMFVYDTDGRLRTALGESGSGAGVIVYDANGMTRGTFVYVDEFDSAAVTMNGDAGSPRVVLHAADNAPELGLYDADGQMRTRLVHSDKDGPGVTLFDADGSETWQAP